MIQPSTAAAAPSSGASWDPAWETVYRTQAWGQYPSEHVIRFVARRWYRVADRSRVRLLDLGSGPGATTWYVAREGFSAAAIDGSTTAIQQLETRLSKDGLIVDAAVGDLAALPWPDASFDGVIDNASMYANRYADCERIIREVRRVLKPGGAFFSASFTDRTWGYGTGTVVEPGGYTDIPEGPLAGKGMSLFFSRARLTELLRSFASTHMERAAWTLGEEQHTVEMWIVSCER